MKDMTELERRITAALDRIATHVDSLERPVAKPTPEKTADTNDLPPATELMADLEAERAVTAQLEERVRAIKEKQDTQVAQLESNLADARKRLTSLEEENGQLRDAASTASETTSTNDDNAVAEMTSELDRLRAERAAEKAELAALLAELKPIVEESASA